MVALAWRRPVARSPAQSHGPETDPTRVGLGGFVRTTVGGYVAFLVIVLIFHVWLAEEPDAFTNAVWAGAFLSGIALAVAWGSSLLGRRSRRHW